jgi:hypothetical protein
MYDNNNDNNIHKKHLNVKLTKAKIRMSLLGYNNKNKKEEYLKLFIKEVNL